MAFNLTVTNDGNGTTNPTGVVSVEDSVPLEIVASPSGGYGFINWTVVSGDAAFDDENALGTNVYVYSGDATIRANFGIAANLTVTNDGNGATNPSGLVTGARFNIQATANPGYFFSSWSVVSGVVVFDNQNNPNTYADITGDAVIRATFFAGWNGVLSIIYDQAAGLFAGTRGGGIFRSSDAGNSWVPKNTGLTDHNVYCLFKGSSHVLAGTDSGVYYSSDNGDTWNAPGVYNEVRVTAIVTCNGKTYAGCTNSNGVLESTDDGVTWSILGGSPTGQVYSLAVLGSDLYVAYNFARGISKFDGTNWSDVTYDLPDVQISILTAFDNTLVAGLYDTGGGIFKLIGSNWVKISPDDDVRNPGTKTWVTIGVLSVANNTLYYGSEAGDGAGGVYQYSGDGTNWTALGLDKFPPYSWYWEHKGGSAIDLNDPDYQEPDIYAMADALNGGLFVGTYDNNSNYGGVYFGSSEPPVTSTSTTLPPDPLDPRAFIRRKSHGPVIIDGGPGGRAVSGNGHEMSDYHAPWWLQ